MLMAETRRGSEKREEERMKSIKLLCNRVYMYSYKSIMSNGIMKDFRVYFY